MCRLGSQRETEIAAHLNKHFRKHVRIAAENSEGRYSSTWIFWGRKSDFYFGAKSVSGVIKVSLHENGIGYFAYDKKYFLRKKSEGYDLPKKTITEWSLPTPKDRGAVHVGRVLFPSAFCFGEATKSIREKKTLVIGVAKGMQLQIDLFFSREAVGTLEAKFLRLGGNPLFSIELDNKLIVSLVARYVPFDIESLTVNGPGRLTMLEREPFTLKNLNAILCNDPAKYGAICLTDIGGGNLGSMEAESAEMKKGKR